MSESIHYFLFNPWSNIIQLIIGLPILFFYIKWRHTKRINKIIKEIEPLYEGYIVRGSGKLPDKPVKLESGIHRDKQ